MKSRTLDKTLSGTRLVAVVTTLILLSSGALWAQEGTQAAASQGVPERTFAGQTLEVRDEHFDLGEVFYVWPGDDAQVAIVSSAPEQQLVVTADRMVGYAIVPFEREEAENPLPAAAFRLPTVQLSTGIDSIDQFLHGGMLLDAASHPEIGIEVASFSDVERTSHSESETVFQGTLALKVHAKGAVKDLSFPAKVSIRPFVTMAPRNPVVGDRLVIEAQFELTPAELGLAFSNPRMQARMAPRIPETLPVRLYLMLGNVSPEKPGNPVDDPAVIHSRLRFTTLLRDLRDPAQAYAYARKLMEESWDNAATLNDIADTVVSTQVEPRDLGLAHKAASRAVALSEEGNAGYLATLAQVHFLRAEYAQAVEWQEKAVSKAQGRFAAPLQAGLERYRTFASQE
ncbi:MAG TPA: hypothetical protein VLV83_05770 [Acidobacteriota bacterium]|nr:hypothetical protein [Acidobacteriota bacterium]